jgi:hypothetical protein
MSPSIASDINRELMEILRMYYSVFPSEFAGGLDRKMEAIAAEQELRQRLARKAA